MPRRTVSIPLLAAGVATALSVAPARADDVEPVAVPESPAPAPPSEPPPADPPSAEPAPSDPPATPPAAELPIELPIEVPVDAPIEVPVHAPGGAPVVRSGRAGDAPAAPTTALPLAPGEAPAADPVPDRGPAPDSPQPPRQPQSGRTSGEEPRATTKVPPGARASSTSVPAAGAPPAPPTQHVVTAGEHLWSIAASYVAAASGRMPAEVPPVDIAPYWTQLCLLNEARLRSGDVNLIHPGEVLDLPVA